jgi:hypothetical protein
VVAIGGLRTVIRILRGTFSGDVAKQDTTLVPSGLRLPILSRSLDEALIGLSLSVLDAKRSAADNISMLAVQGVPCWPELTKDERLHEEALIALLTADLTRLVDLFCAAAARTYLGYSTFEVDAAKRFYRAYGAQRTPSGTPELIVRATANHAVLPMATLIARLAFLKTLDGLPDTADEIFVTNGGCAAGKGSLLQVVTATMGGSLRTSAVWDAAGEGDAEENAWILEAARVRKLRVIYGFVANNPLATYRSVLDRALEVGRIVDPVTFARSYTRGTANMRAFLASGMYLDAERDGLVSAVGIDAGPWDPVTRTYPSPTPLGTDGTLSASDLVGLVVPGEDSVIAAAVEILAKWLDLQRIGGSVEHWVQGAVINTFKFENWR